MKSHYFLRKVLIIFTAMFIAHAVLAQIPQTISYQGLLTNTNNEAVADGNYKLTFKLFNSDQGGTAIWQEAYDDVVVTGGLFNVSLGGKNPLSLPFDQPYWLEITIAEESPLNPRIELTASAYSLNSRAVADSAITSAKIADSQVVRSINTLKDSVRLVAGNNITITTDADSIVISTNVNQGGDSDGHSLNAADGDPADAIYVDNDGKIGIGKTDPTEVLDVEGNIKSSGKILAGAYSSTSPLIFEAPEGSERARIDDVSGNFGIGTKSPLLNFHLSRSAGMSPPPTRLGVQWSVIPLPPLPALTDWFYYAVGGIGIELGGTHMIRKSGNNLRFSTQDEMLSGPITEQMRLTDNGALGIGTKQPYHRLQVNSSDDTKDAAARFMNDNGSSLLDIGVSANNGSSGAGNDNPYIYTNNKDLVIITGSGNIFSNGGDLVVGNGGGILVSGGGKIDIMDENGNGVISLDPTQNNRKITTPILEITGGGDLAEPFDIADTEVIKPGTVVAIDPENAGQLRIADKAYDRTVVGCVSGANGINPGLTMQQEGTVADGSLPVALSGRVYCRADASYGSIRPGDLLTTSDTPGHAMKVTDHARAQGAILGKAMTPLQEGTGFVLVLVTLQ